MIPEKYQQVYHDKKNEVDTFSIHGIEVGETNLHTGISSTASIVSGLTTSGLLTGDLTTDKERRSINQSFSKLAAKFKQNVDGKVQDHRDG